VKFIHILLKLQDVYVDIYQYKFALAHQIY